VISGKLVSLTHTSTAVSSANSTVGRRLPEAPGRRGISSLLNRHSRFGPCLAILPVYLPPARVSGSPAGTESEAIASHPSVMLSSFIEVSLVYAINHVPYPILILSVVIARYLSHLG
jgi:hypothetical protein